MNYQILLPARFDSNMYVYRQKLSEKLTSLVAYRLDLDSIPHNQEYLETLDALIKSTHYKFIDLIKTIDTFEADSFAFGSNCWPQLTAAAAKLEVFEHIIINNHSK